MERGAHCGESLGARTVGFSPGGDFVDFGVEPEFAGGVSDGLPRDVDGLLQEDAAGALFCGNACSINLGLKVRDELKGRFRK